MTALQIHLTPTTVFDLEQIMAIEKASFPFPWTKGMFLNELLDKSYSTSFIAREAGDARVIGYVFIKTLYDELHLLNIAVDPMLRRKGVGAALLRQTLSFLEVKRMRKMILEVRVSNRPALDLYLKFGFREIGLRPNYYCQPTENALLLQYEAAANSLLGEGMRT